jgi:hypothetical protein
LVRLSSKRQNDECVTTKLGTGRALEHAPWLCTVAVIVNGAAIGVTKMVTVGVGGRPLARGFNPGAATTVVVVGVSGDDVVPTATIVVRPGAGRLDGNKVGVVGSSLKGVSGVRGRPSSSSSSSSSASSSAVSSSSRGKLIVMGGGGGFRLSVERVEDLTMADVMCARRRFRLSSRP